MKNRKLFDYIYEAVYNSGGDGDALVCFSDQDYRSVADDFMSYLIEINSTDWIMNNRGEFMLIYRDQESFIFSDRAFFTEHSKMPAYHLDVEILTY